MKKNHLKLIVWGAILGIATCIWYTILQLIYWI